MKKYLIRAVGALCILGALALMFLPGWVQIVDIDRQLIRDLRSDIGGMLSNISDDFVRQINSDGFKDELKDYDLPYTRSSIKNRFRDIEDLTDQLLDRDFSLSELLEISCKAPGFIKDAQNLTDSICADTFFQSAAEYVLYEGTQSFPFGSVGEEDVDATADLLEETSVNALDILSGFTIVFILLAALLILFILIGVGSAVGHVCNKGRGLKYLFLVILVLLVIASAILFPIVSDMLADSMIDMTAMPAYEDARLQITVTPFLAVALMFVPIILDAVCERKKTNQ